MSDNKVSEEFPDREQRIAVCMSKASEDLPAVAAADLQYNIEEFGYTEDVNEDNFYVPSEDEYVSLASLKITVDEDEEEEEDEEEMDDEEDDEEDDIEEKEEKKEDEKEMKEALDVINTLRSELNEVNLLNAKLLYVNKIFKAKNLSESQKLQVIASFDKATTAKEAKVVFESLNATLTTSNAKKQIKESLGFASKAAGVAPKKAIVESNDVISRMQRLANIIK